MSDFIDKVKGFFGGDPEEIVDEAGDVAGDAAENVVDGVIETQSNLGEYKEIVTIFIVVLVFTCPITYTVVGGVLSKLTKLIGIPASFAASALSDRSWKLWIVHSVVIALVIAGLKHKNLI